MAAVHAAHGPRAGWLRVRQVRAPHQVRFRLVGAALTAILSVGAVAFAAGHEGIASAQIIRLSGERGSVPAQDEGGGDSPLAQAAAALSSGQFGTLVTNGLTQALITRGDGDTILSFAPRGSWNAINHTGYFCGGTHESLNRERCIRYVEATNTWEVEEDDTPEDTGPCTATDGSCQPHHGYFHFDVRPSDGEFFYRLYGTTTVQRRAYNASPPWSSIAAFTGTQFFEYGGTDAIVWYPELYSGEGGLVFASASGFSTTWRQTGNAWTDRSNDVYSGDVNGGFLVYSQDDNRVYFGGGNPSEDMWRMDPDGSVTQVADVPFSVGSGGAQDGDFAGRVCSSATSSGKLFAFDEGGAGASGPHSIREYTPGNPGSWSSEIATLPFTYANAGIFCMPIPEREVVMFVFTSSGLVPSTTVYLWKR